MSEFGGLTLVITGSCIFFELRTLEEGERGFLPVPIPKCKEP